MATNPNKTVATRASVDKFIDSLKDDQQAEDSRQLLEIFGRVTGQPPVMWGTAMIGYGQLQLTYASGRQIEWFEVGFSPRKGKTTLYVTFEADKLINRFHSLGKYTTGKGCIYIKRLSDVDLAELEKLVAAAYSQGWQDPDRPDDKEQTITVENLE